MQQLTEELNLTIAMLEAHLPANPGSPGGQRLEARLEREIRRYFRALEDAMPIEKVEQLYFRLVQQE